MWDDSYDSVPSPMIPKGKSGRNNTGYDGFDNKKGFQKSDQREIDALFSPDNSAPASENNSPDEKFANRKYQDPYAFNEPPKSDNYLANFATNSGDLEDSILGELLGMPKKTPSAPAVNASKPDSTTNSSTFPSSNKIEKGGRKLSPAGKLEPLDTNVAKSPRSASSPIIPNKSTKDPFGKQPINRFSNDGPITSMKSFEFEQNRGVSVDSNTGLTSGGVGGGGRAHFNSFDVTGSNDDYDSSQDDKNEYLPSKPSGYHPTKVDSSVANKRTVTMKNDYQSSNTMGIASAVSYDSVNTEEKPTGNVGSKSNTYNFSAPSLASTSEGEKKKEDEDNNANLGFIPSFLDPSRQGRRRRGGDEGPRSSGGLRGSSDARGGGSKLDELDAALGLATPLAGPTTGNKKPVDPFAAAEKKIPSLPTAAAGKKSTILGDSDSSSDDDLLKPKSRFSITTPKFGKPETTTSTQNPPATNKSVTTFSDSRKESKDTSIPPVADPVPAPSTSNAASSHSIGSAAMNAAKTNLPALGIGSPTNSSVVKLPSPEHKSASFSVKFSRSRDEQEKEKNKLRGSTGSGIDSGHDFGEESDELDISGIVKANDDELARFGLKDSTSTSYGKDKKQKETLKDTHKEKEKDYKDKEKEKEGLASPTQIGIQLSRKSVGNIRPNVSPLTGKPAGSSSTYGNELKSPLSSGQMKMMNLSSSMDDETSPRPGLNNTNLGSRSKEYSSGVDKKDMYSSLLSNSSDGLNVGKNNTTAPLPISPKKPSHRTSERDRAPTITLPADQHDGKIDEILEQTKQQKEKNEKEMLSEIESLKNKLYHLESQSITRSNAALGGGGVGGNNFDLENENRILMEQNQRLLNEQLQSKRIISQLEIEVIRLKDEINLQQSKHLTDYRQLNEKHDGEVKEIQLKHELDIETIEKRHSEVIQAMKEIHQQEIQSYKDRTKSTDQFDNMMKLIHQTTGSMKYLEEQLSVKHQSIQHVQKSHLDSREKQLMDLEEKAKDRIELVELEEYKLKGILLHMETLMNSLRSQNLEEKERLQSEHQRLSILQTSLINEKVNFQQQITSEYALLKEKQKEFEYKQLENEKLKLQSFEEINHQQHQLELMKREIETERLVIKKSYEQKERFLQDEEKRLLRQQEEMMNEKLLFQQYKQSCEQELTVLEDSKKLLKKAIEQLTIEKEEVYYQSKQVNIQLQHNHEKEEELKQLQENLLLKENIINHSFQEMKIAANELTLQEKQLHSYLSEMEGKKRDLVNMDQSLLEKKLIYFQQFRDTLLNNVIDQQQYQSQLVLPPPPSASPSLLNKENQPNHLMTGQQGREAQFNMMPNTLGIYQTKSTDIDDGMQPISSSFSAPSNPNIVPGLTSTGYAMSSPSKGVSSNTYHNQGNDWTSQFKQKMQLAYAGNHHPERLLPKEIQSAQKLLKENRSFLQKHSNIEIRKFLNQEESFVTNLERLQRHQQKEGGEGGNNIYRK